MSSAAMETAQAVPPGESKSARKKRAKVEAQANGTPTTAPTAPALPQTPGEEASSQGAEAEGALEHPHLRELQKQMRNLHKRLAGLQKIDVVQQAHPGVSLDQLVAQRHINLDQKAAAEKKPQIQAQLKDVETQVRVFRQVTAEYQAQTQKQKEDLTAAHQQELRQAKEAARLEAMAASAGQLREKLLLFSQFLSAAAAKRNIEEEAGTDEGMAFEGALLLVYGGDKRAVDAAVSIIDGTDEPVPNIEGSLLGVKCRSHPLSLPYHRAQLIPLDRFPDQAVLDRPRPLPNRRAMGQRCR